MEARSPSGRRGAAVLFVAFALCGGGDGIARAVGEQSLPQRAEDTEPLAPGVRVPPVSVRTIDGEEVALLRVLGRQPAVLVFYRGGWCPYCSGHLGQLKKAEPEITARGYRIFAISADRPEKLRESVARLDIAEDLSYTLLSDAPLHAARAFGIAFQLDAQTVDLYRRAGIDLEEASGETHHGLPVPSVFVVDADGVIRFTHSNPDYKVRLAPEKLLAALDAMTGP
jgi:peroxiredoxin